jgi:hypothetical protein
VVVSAAFVYHRHSGATEILESESRYLDGLDLRLLVVPATLVYRKPVGAIEILESGSRYLDGSNLRLWWYQLLWCITGMLVPVRYSKVNLGVSVGRICECGSTSCFGVLKTGECH